MFKTQAVILHIHKIRDLQWRIVVFSREYGKISCWTSKTKFDHDIWDIVNLIVERKEWRNIINKVDYFITNQKQIWSYDTLRRFLEILKTLYIVLPEMVPQNRIFSDYKSLIEFHNTCEVLDDIYPLFLLRILKTLWFVGEDEFRENQVLLYIFRNIESEKIQKILQTKKLQTSDRESIDKINLLSLHRITL